MKVLSVLILFAFASTSGDLYAQEFVKADFNVYVVVTAENTYENLLQHYLIRSLREIEDVKLVSYENAFDVIQVISLKTSSGLYIASLVVKSPIQNDAIIKSGLYFGEDGLSLLEDDIKLNDALESFKNTSIGKMYLLAIVDAYTEKYHSIYTDSDLSSLAERIVADVNIEVFQPQKNVIEDLNILNKN